MLKDPDVLVLDEPTNGLDPEGIYEVREYIRKIANEKNITVLISSHLLDELEKMCDRAIIIKKGEIIQFMDLHDDKQEKQITYVLEGLDIEAAQKILLENGYHVVSKDRQEIRIRIGINEKNDVAKLLVSHNIVMTGLYEACETLEDTFLELMKD